MKRRIRWAIFTALLSVVLAVALGVAALTYSDEEHVAATPIGPIEGNYTFVSTTISTGGSAGTASVSGLPSPLSVTGGRLSIGGDAHAAWSYDMQTTTAPSRTGRLTCEGTFNRGANTITLEPRFGYNGFPPEMDRREVQDELFVLFCSAAGRPGAGTVVVQPGPGVLQLSGAGGTISWRRE